MLKTGEAPLRISRSFLNEAPRYVYNTVAQRNEYERLNQQKAYEQDEDD